VAGDLTATLRQHMTTRQTWDTVAGPGGATVVLPTLYWPGWRATIDDQLAELTAQPGSGLMTLPVPEGAHVVTLELHRTPVRAAAEWLSLVVGRRIIPLRRWERVVCVVARRSWS
jgi:hypothetical protein